MKQNSSLYVLLLVGVVSGLGPFVTDFYLPALPALVSYFDTNASMIQLTLTVSMIGLAVGQLFIGPLSDRYGRKVPLLASLLLFILSTAGCLTAISIDEFLVFRFIQGLAGAGGVVISKSIATDLYEGKKLVRFFSVLSSVQGLAPILAPVFGGLLLTVTTWQGIFWTMLVLGMILFIATYGFRESLPVRSNNIVTTFKNYSHVLRNREFMRFVLIQAMAMGVMFTYIAASPFIFQDHYGLSPVVYSMCFSVNAVGIMIGSLFTIRFETAKKALLFGVRSFTLMSIVVAMTLIADLPIYFVEGAIFIMLITLGIILPTSTTLSLELVREHSGSASAILGFLTFFVGGVCSPLAGLGDMLISTSILIVLCAFCTLLLVKKRVKK